MDNDDKICMDLFAAAQAHGDEMGSAYEAGDLQDLFLAAWSQLTFVQRAAFFRDARIVALLEIEEYAGIAKG